MVQEAPILFEKVDDHIGVITLNRPNTLNALCFDTLHQMKALFDQLSTDLDTRVLILTGAGKGFCAGADLKDALSDDSVWDEKRGPVQSDYLMQQAYANVASGLRKLPQPVIAAVNGVAAGAGFSLTLACDVRIAVPTAKFNCAFTSIGLGGGDVSSSYYLPKILGPSLAAELMYSGRFIEAEESLHQGLISRICEPNELMHSAVAMAKQFVNNTSPFGLRATKEVFNLSLEGLSLDQMLHIENRNQVLALQTSDFKNSVESWLNGEKFTYADK